MTDQKQFTIKFRRLPWVREQSGDWVADVRPYFYRVSHHDGPYEVHGEDGALKLDGNGKPVVRQYSGWLAWPFCPHHQPKMGSGEHISCVPYVAAPTAEGCMNQVEKVHQRRVAKHLVLIEKEN